MITYSHITPNSYVDGPGCRTVAFLQGCTVGCKGCQNRALWPANGGHRVEVGDLAREIMAHGNKNITISGGEPTDQLWSLHQLVTELRELGAEHIIVYSGRTVEKLLETETLQLFMLVALEIDILVDGPFIPELDDPLITWRGSRNQRPIDCAALVETGEIVTLDWSKPEIQVDADGNLHMPAGLAEVFAEAGEVTRSRMCGQTKPISK